MKVGYSYFHTPEPTKFDWGETEGDYAGTCEVVTSDSYEWTHSMSDIINSIITAGLKIEFLHEFPVIFYKCYPFMEQDGNGFWRVKGDKIPLIFTIKATKTT